MAALSSLCRSLSGSEITARLPTYRMSKAMYQISTSCMGGGWWCVRVVVVVYVWEGEGGGGEPVRWQECGKRESTRSAALRNGATNRVVGLPGATRSRQQAACCAPLAQSIPAQGGRLGTP